jgi:uncharacterized membrane protein
MEVVFSEYFVKILLRWFHVFAGILWVGTTYYFTWLDGRLHEESQVWMVHSGGFYVVEKKGVEGELTHRLHWFRYEALLTWLSGFVLLILEYYLANQMVDATVYDLSHKAAVGLGVGLLIVSWVVYDLLARSPLGRNEMAFAVVAFALVAGVSYGLMRVMSGRAAYLHVGAVFGTIMALNVWMRILPAQKRMIAAIKASQPPDLSFGAQAKLRSKHNTFMAVPVVFIMVSNHYPSLYDSWPVLIAMILLGWLAAKIIRRA